MSKRNCDVTVSLGTCIVIILSVILGRHGFLFDCAQKYYVFHSARTTVLMHTDLVHNICLLSVLGGHFLDSKTLRKYW